MKVHYVDLNVFMAVNFTFQIWSGITYGRKCYDVEVYSLERMLKIRARGYNKTMMARIMSAAK